MSERLLHASPEWFAMVGTLMCETAADAALPADLHLSLVERYTDGIVLPGRPAQGLRFEIAGGQPAFRVGVRPEEEADITIAITAAASRELNTLYAADPRFAAALERLQASGAMRVEGELARLGDWFGAVHDRIVARTR